MEFIFAIENYNLLLMSNHTVTADSVPAAWQIMNEILQPDEEATLIYIGDAQVGEVLQEYIIKSL